MATEQEKILQQREEEIAKLKSDLGNYIQLHEEIAQLKIKNEEKDVAIRSNEQSKSTW